MLLGASAGFKDQTRRRTHLKDIIKEKLYGVVRLEVQIS